MQIIKCFKINQLNINLSKLKCEYVKIKNKKTRFQILFLHNVLTIKYQTDNICP